MEIKQINCFLGLFRFIVALLQMWDRL